MAVNTHAHTEGRLTTNILQRWCFALHAVAMNFFLVFAMQSWLYALVKMYEDHLGPHADTHINVVQ